MIRDATHDDIPAMLKMARKFHAISRDAGIEFGEQSATAFAEFVMGHPGGIALIGDSGFFLGLVSPSPYLDPSFLIANELIWWAEKDGRTLFKAFLTKAKEKGAKRIVASFQDDGRSDGLARMLKAYGFNPHERHVAMEIDNVH